MHWADSVAGELLARSRQHVIETGTSISGVPHIGNASDVIRGDAVKKALESKGVDVELIWIADDSDPLRKIPRGFEKIKDYLGYPVNDIPDPFRCHKSFVEHFVEPFLSDLRAFGVAFKSYSGTQLYRSGELYDEIKTALDRSSEIASILNQFRETPLQEDKYIPWNPICGRCGKISSVKPISRSGDVVKYVCESRKLAAELLKAAVSQVNQIYEKAKASCLGGLSGLLDGTTLMSHASLWVKSMRQLAVHIGQLNSSAKKFSTGIRRCL